MTHLATAAYSYSTSALVQVTSASAHTDSQGCFSPLPATAVLLQYMCFFLMSVISVCPVSPSVYLSLSVCTHMETQTNKQTKQNRTTKTQDIYPPLTLPFCGTPLEEYPKCQSSVIFPLACDISITDS